MANQVNTLSPVHPLSVSHNEGGSGRHGKWILAED